MRMIERCKCENGNAHLSSLGREACVITSGRLFTAISNVRLKKLCSVTAYIVPVPKYRGSDTIAINFQICCEYVALNRPLWLYRVSQPRTSSPRCAGNVARKSLQRGLRDMLEDFPAEFRGEATGGAWRRSRGGLLFHQLETAWRA